MTEQGGTYLAVSWSVSRGRDTDGYNICRLDDTATGKRYRCMGGGYDMTGTVFGEWLQDVAQDRLRAVAGQAHMTWGAPEGDGPRPRTTNDDGLYGMSFDTQDGRVTLDGACGINSMQRIAKTVGLETRATVNRKGHVTGYVVTDTKGSEGN